MPLGNHLTGLLTMLVRFDHDSTPLEMALGAWHGIGAPVACFRRKNGENKLRDTRLVLAILTRDRLERARLPSFQLQNASKADSLGNRLERGPLFLWKLGPCKFTLKDPQS